MRPRILIFCDYYLPGFKAGGGMWAVVNLVDRFSAEYDFFIVTRNHDLSDSTPYREVDARSWNQVGNAKVYFFEEGELTTRRAAELVTEIAPDAMYLNSAFSMPVLRFLSARRKKLVGNIPVVLAPCGEFPKAALAIKRVKKRAFLLYAKTVGLYNDVIWKASFESDADDIRGIFGTNIEVMTAPDLLPESILPDYSPSWKPEKVSGNAKFVFLSRISPKKNLAYLLERFKDIRVGEVSLDIIGPIDDETYWQRCKSIIAGMPKNVLVNLVGALPNNAALERTVESHFFVLPTLNENFGYVFIEALAAGCPLMISDNTVWTDIDEKGVGWQTSLDEPERWYARIEDCIAMDNKEYSQLSNRARKYAADWLGRPEINDATARVLERAILRGTVSAANGR